MGKELVINRLEDLYAFLNEKGALEIALRHKNKRFKQFQKVIIDKAALGENQKLLNDVAKVLNKNLKLNKQQLNVLTSLSKLNKLGLILNGLNLCATCVGFAIMFQKLDRMSAKINQQLNELKKVVHGVNDVQNTYEFDKVLAEHTNMLDCQRKQQPYSEDQMRELVDQEYNVLKLLIETLKRDISGNHDDLIFSIFSLLAMLTVSLRNFDEIYYFKYRDVLGNQDKWHLGHKKWMGVYDTLTQRWFIEKLQDHAFLELDLTTDETDLYYQSLVEQVNDLREEVEDNQRIIEALDDINLLKQYNEFNTEDIKEQIKDAFYKAGSGLDESTILQSYQDAIATAVM